VRLKTWRRNGAKFMGQFMGCINQMALTNRIIARAKVEEGKTVARFSDGGNLYLTVKGPHNKSFSFRFYRNGKTHEVGLGSTHLLPLEEARKRALELKTILKSGGDPCDSQRHEKAPTFSEASWAYILANRIRWTDKKAAREWTNTLSKYANPVIGDKRVDEIDTLDVISILYPIWRSKHPTAVKVRGRIEAVIDFAKVTHSLGFSNPAIYTKGMKSSLPVLNSEHRVQHFRHLNYYDCPSFFEQLMNRDGESARALAWTIMTVARSGAVRHMRWQEIDLKQRVWTAPASHMKKNREHRTPLTRKMIVFLGSPGNPMDLVFPAPRSANPQSDASLLAVIKRMKRHDDTVVHGFRASFTDFCRDKLLAHPEVVEAALAHQKKDATYSAYARSDLLKPRRKLMKKWVKYLGL